VFEETLKSLDGLETVNVGLTLTVILTVARACDPIALCIACACAGPIATPKSNSAREARRRWESVTGISEQQRRHVFGDGQ
jgi:hypothetical protein